MAFVSLTVGCDKSRSTPASTPLTQPADGRTADVRAAIGKPKDAMRERDFSIRIPQAWTMQSPAKGAVLQYISPISQGAKKAALVTVWVDDITRSNVQRLGIQRLLDTNVVGSLVNLKKSLSVFVQNGAVVYSYTYIYSQTGAETSSRSTDDLFVSGQKCYMVRTTSLESDFETYTSDFGNIIKSFTVNSEPSKSHTITDWTQGFQISFPEDWKVEPEATVISIPPPGSPAALGTYASAEVAVWGSHDEKKATPREFMAEVMGDAKDVKLSEAIEVRVAGARACKITRDRGDDQQTLYFLAISKRRYTIRCLAHREEYSKCLPTFDNIISTFKVMPDE